MGDESVPTGGLRQRLILLEALYRRGREFDDWEDAMWAVFDAADREDV